MIQMHLFTVLVEWESTMQTMIDVETLLVSENKHFRTKNVVAIAGINTQK